MIIEIVITLYINHYELLIRKFGGLAQLARAPALQAGGQRFESVILHYSGEFEGKGNHIFHLSSLIWNEIFDILTHKTVSKDL